MRAWHFLLFAVFGVAARTWAAEAATDGRAFLGRYCVKCHSGDSPKGDLDLEKVIAQELPAKVSVWQQVLEKIESGEMPPKSKPRPPAEEAKVAADWIHAQVTTAKAAQRDKEGRVVLRRLNRLEYENTVRDLLGVEVNVRELLPPDSS